MKNIRAIIFILLSAAVCLHIPPSDLVAETIHLKNGRIIQGKIIRETETALVVKIGIGEVLISKVDINDQGSPGDTGSPDPEKSPEAAEGCLKPAERTGVKGDNAEDVFKERLTDLLARSRKGDDAISLDIAMRRLKYFASEHPDSIYADDALIVLNYLAFLGAVTAGNKEDIPDYSGAIESLFKEQPNARLEMSTYNTFLETMGLPSGTSFDAIRLPLNDLSLYLSGMLSVRNEEWEAVITKFLKLRNEIADETGLEGVLTEIYPWIATAYNQTGKYDYAYNTAKEAVSRFPENDAIKKIWETFNR